MSCPLGRGILVWHAHEYALRGLQLYSIPRTLRHVSGETACPMQLLKHAPDNRLRQEFPQFARRTPLIPNIPKLTQFHNFRNCLIIRGRQMNSEHSEIAAISEFSEFVVGFGAHHQMSIDLR